jgi:hypothetical protein
MQAALEAALAELVLGAPLPAENPAALQSLLVRHGVSPEDASALLEQGVARLLVYRSLVRETLEAALNASIPRSLARLGPLFDEYFERFLSERGPRTHYLRDVTTEFLDFCERLWRKDGRIPGYLLELARHEALHIEIASIPPPAVRSDPAALDLDAGLEFTEAARLVHYRHAVHELPEALEDRTEPEARETHLFVYRSPEHYVRYLSLSPIAASIVGWLMRGASLRHGLTRAADEHRAALDDVLLSGTARLLSDLSERMAVLGPRRPTFDLQQDPP